LVAHHRLNLGAHAAKNVCWQIMLEQNAIAKIIQTISQSATVGAILDLKPKAAVHIAACFYRSRTRAMSNAKTVARKYAIIER
jgi:uncharacterized protein VirK/YbjX